MMRRKFAVCLILLTLLTVIVGGCERKENNMPLRNQPERMTQTEKPSQTEKSADSASSTMSGEKIEDKNEKFSVKALLCEYDSNNFYRNQVAKYKVTGNTDTTQTKSML